MEEVMEMAKKQKQTEKCKKMTYADALRKTGKGKKK